MNRESITRANDPSLTKGLRDRYEAALSGLFVKAAPKIISALTGVKENAEITGATSLSPALVRPTVAYVLEYSVEKPGEFIIKTYISQAYKAGETRGKEELKAAGLRSSLVGFQTNPQAIELLQERNLAALKGISDETGKRIIAELTDGMLKGEGVDKLAKRIRDSVDTIGVSRSKAMAQTEAMTAFNHAAKDQYLKHNVTEVKWKTSKLENVCEVCNARDNEMYPIDEAPDCPAHPNCHCILQPVIKEVSK